MHNLIDFLQRKNLVWQGTDRMVTGERHPSGFPLLDEKLAGGFPRHSLIEIRSLTGIGEIRLLQPLMKEHSGLKVFIQPPAMINAEFLHHNGIDLNTILFINPKEASEGLWAAEQCLQSGSCDQVFLWQQHLSIKQVKRLQLASEMGDCLPFIFRNHQTYLSSLPVALILELSAHKLGMEIRIIKNRGSWPTEGFLLNMSQRWPDLQYQGIADNVIPFPDTRAV